MDQGNVISPLLSLVPEIKENRGVLEDLIKQPKLIGKSAGYPFRLSDKRRN
jgi:hypothetical protein